MNSIENKISKILQSTHNHTTHCNIIITWHTTNTRTRGERGPKGRIHRRINTRKKDGSNRTQSPNPGRNFGSASKSEAFFSPESHLGSVKSFAENEREFYLQELNHFVGPKAENQEEGSRKEVEVLFPNGEIQMVNRPKEIGHQNNETNKPIRANKGALSRIQSHLSDNQKLAQRRSPRISPQKPQPHLDPNGISLNTSLCPFFCLFGFSILLPLAFVCRIEKGLI